MVKVFLLRVVAFCVLGCAASHPLYAQQWQESSSSSSVDAPKVLGAGHVNSFADTLSTVTTQAITGQDLTTDIRYGIFKSDQDKRRYRYLVLPNKMRVLLISDKNAENSSAALSVHVGAYDNPQDREGLAHFLEHMLFLGTQKYPNAGEYQQFIAAHGGKHNAYTAQETTTYFFDVANDQFAQALDRFAQFFIAPLFNATYVERERQAVQAEFTAKLKDDGRRAWEVYREVINPLHPAAKFSVGDVHTLADWPKRPVREELIAFYEQHYSADEMVMVLLGQESIETLTDWAKHYFSAVPLRETKKTNTYAPLVNPTELPFTVEIVPEQERREISFNFPVQFNEKYQAHKTYDYLANLIGHEGRGSLIAFLRRLGWAESIDAGLTMKSHQDAMFNITIELTAAGFKARDQIPSLVFYALDQMRTRGVVNWRYQELEDVAEAKFRFKEKPSAIETTVELVEKMFWYEPTQILRNDLWFAGLNERQLKDAFEKLSPRNLFIVATSPDVSPHRLSRRYSAPYTVRREVPNVYDIKTALKQELQLPERNLFIPKRLDVKSASLLDRSVSNDNRPEMIFRDRDARVWFASGREFNQPKASLHIDLKLPLVSLSAQGAAHAKVLAAMVNDELVEYAYPAKLAGIDYRIDANTRGFDIAVTGFSSRQNLLLNRIVEVLAAPKLRLDKFELKRAQLLRELRNLDKAMPYQVMLNQVAYLQSAPAWQTQALIDALESTDFNRFNKFVNNVLIDAKMDMLIYGNYFRQEAIKLSVMVDHSLLSRQTGRAMPPMTLLGVGGAQTKPQLFVYPMQHPDALAMLWVSAEATDVSAAAHMKLLQQLLKPGFFHTLRTEKQLGYVVAVIPQSLRQLEGMAFLIQSPFVKADKLITEIDNYLKSVGPELVENIAENRISLANKLREPAPSLTEQARRYWESVKTEDWSFNRREHLAIVVDSISAESLQTFYQQRVLSPNSQLWMINHPITGRSNKDLIENVELYKQSRRAFPFQ